MPKILDEARENLLRAARRQVLSVGYSGMTMRSVAQECGYSVGTVYNYFKSKDYIVAAFMLEDWQQLNDSLIGECAGKAANEGLRLIYKGVQEFTTRYHPLFTDKNAQKTYAMAPGAYNERFMAQLTKLIASVLSENGIDGGELLPQFIADAVEAWVARGESYEALEPLFMKLISKE